MFLKQNRKVWIATSMCVLSMLSTRVDGQTQATNSPYNWDNLPEIQQPIFRKDTLDIRDFGAKGDGMTLNTKSINDAIAASNQNQGGVVFIPAGYWLSGPIELKSNVNLHLADNAFLQFTADFDQYPIVEGNYEGKPSARNQSPISGKNLKNIAITGAGTIDGNGDAWRMVGRGALTEREWRDKVAAGGLVSADGKTWFPSEKTKRAHEEKRSVLLTEERTLADFEDIKDYLRPNLLVLTNCEKVLLEGVTFQNSPAWNLHPLMSRHVTIRDVKIKNPDYAQNGDGIDIESCSNVLIEDCILDVGDDAICIKSGKDEEGRKRGIPTEKVIIRRNKVYLGHGGFVVGSEMSGGARDIFVENCTFMGTDKGIRFKTTRGRGGIVENIHIRDINMSNIVDEAIFFDMYYWTKPPQANEVQEIPPVTEETPKIRNVFIENVQCNGAKVGVFVRGLPEMPVQHIHLKNLNLTVDKGIEIKDTQFLTIENAAFYTASDAPLLYVESAQDLTFNKLKLDNKQPHRVEIHGSNSTNILLTDSKIDSGNISFHNGAKKQGIKIN